MSVTRLKRKHRKNIARANNKKSIIKELLRTPVLKNVDLEELKSRFTTPGAAAPAATAPAAKAAKTTGAADNAAAFDAADAVTKPVNADGQEGEHPKPEIAL
ncbi:hypothetical protein ACFP2F_15745 [Hymenobacter artigasi]|uniref:Ribosomal protein L12E/L44/L45/RPP1/RPP2 n=1 Tax=Hymenobacter artigasi TaxID=2719616 RepID=A0ABX1HIX7_9BACT|nr:hypothetical protein [Hymenobacter artigasi]NKI89800.1 ribosomal protein L12E/L44/L45/RPP1/RPP2 [Hymenobacter artigasi]